MAAMLKSHTITGHFIRGVVGFGFLAIVLVYCSSLGWWTLIPAAGALLAFRGWPMCWTAGLVETVLYRKSRACPDGSCSTKRPMGPEH